MTEHKKHEIKVDDILHRPEMVTDFWLVTQVIPQDVQLNRPTVDAVVFIAIPYASSVVEEYTPKRASKLQAQLFDDVTLYSTEIVNWPCNKETFDATIGKNYGKEVGLQ
jgi:hypothetical protein